MQQQNDLARFQPRTDEPVGLDATHELPWSVVRALGIAAFCYMAGFPCRANECRARDYCAADTGDSTKHLRRLEEPALLCFELARRPRPLTESLAGALAPAHL